LVGYHLLLRDSGPYRIIFMNAYVVITIAMVMLLRDLGSYGLIFMTMQLFMHGLLCACTSIKRSTVIITSKLL
jgi:hypothetical protein